MAISRMNMERQMRNMGGIMGLEDQRQGYFLGKLVKKITKPIKKIIKSPIGKMAMLAAAGYGLGGAKFLGGKGIFAGGQGLGRFANLKNLFLPAASNPLGKRGLLAGLAFDDKGQFSLGRAALSGLGATAIAAPFLMGDEEEVIDEGIDVSGIQPMVANIRQQARDYYQDPTKSALYFMPPKAAVQSSFYAANGGLADIPREGYDNGGEVMTDAEREKMLIDLADYFMERGLSESEAYEAAVKQLYADGGRVGKAEGGIMDMGGLEKDYREGGFVPLGAEERADDVPARLSKNEFVFTADAVRNAGQGDIDRGAEVMQNMMDNLEAGGTISEESQGMENPAQEMFDQSQMLESRII
jgi:hypothetical protein